MSEYFTASGGYIVAEVKADANGINGSGRAEMPVLLVMLQMLFRSPKQLGVTYDFRELRCRLSPFDGTYIATSLPAPLNIHLGPAQELANQLVYLEIPLDQNRLAVINRLRKGGDVKLRLDLELFADELVEIPKSQNAPSAGWGLREHRHMQARVQVEIPRSKWVEQVLPGTGFGTIHILELPVIPIESCAEIQTAFNELQQAYKLESQGFYNEAVAACRKALEPFFERITKPDDKGVMRKFLVLKSSWQTRLGQATYDWLNASLIAVKQGADKTHHLSSSSFGQMEAQMLLTVATSLIAYAIKTRPESPQI